MPKLGSSKGKTHSKGSLCDLTSLSLGFLFCITRNITEDRLSHRVGLKGGLQFPEVGPRGQGELGIGAGPAESADGRLNLRAVGSGVCAAQQRGELAHVVTREGGPEATCMEFSTADL